MRFPTVEYMQWAKSIPEDALQIGASGVPAATLADLGLPGELPIAMHQDGLYGSPAAAERIASRYGVPASRVYPTEGTSLANFLALAALLEDGGRALVESPVYTPFLQQVEALAGAVDFFERPPAEGFGVDPGRVAAALRPGTRVVVLTDLHNPSGARLPAAVAREVAELAAGAGAQLLIDEVYHDFLYDEPPATAAALAPNIVTTSSLTKVYGLGNLRFGWLIGPERLVHRASRINDYLGVLQPSPSVSLGLRAFDHLGSLGRRSRELVEGSRPVLEQWLDTRPDLETFWPQAGPIVFPRVLAAAAGDTGGGENSPVTTDRLASRLLEESRVSVVPGRFFRAPAHLRLGATAAAAELRQGLARLGAALDGGQAGGNG